MTDAVRAWLAQPAEPNARGTERPGRSMDIVQAARSAGLSAKRARHYQAIGLLGAPPSGVYDDTHVAVLRFIRSLRALGFSIGEVRALVELWADRGRPPQEVARLAERHAGDIERRIAVLQTMLGALRALMEGCAAGERPRCPVLHEPESRNAVG